MRLARRTVLWPSMTACPERTEMMSSSRFLINATTRGTETLGTLSIWLYGSY
ncbi:unnamed protein product, partial [Fusarium graminearum]